MGEFRTTLGDCMNPFIGNVQKKADSIETGSRRVAAWLWEREGDCKDHEALLGKMFCNWAVVRLALSLHYLLKVHGCYGMLIMPQ